MKYHMRRRTVGFFIFLACLWPSAFAQEPTPQSSPIKQDIRGARLGMTKAELIALVPQCDKEATTNPMLLSMYLGNWQVEHQRALPVPPVEYQATGILCEPFDDGSDLEVAFAPEVTGGQLLVVSYAYKTSLLNTEDRAAEIESNFGLPAKSAIRGDCDDGSTLDPNYWHWQITESICLGFTTNLFGTKIILTLKIPKAFDESSARAIEIWAEKAPSQSPRF